MTANSGGAWIPAFAGMTVATADTGIAPLRAAFCHLLMMVATAGTGIAPPRVAFCYLLRSYFLAGNRAAATRRRSDGTAEEDRVPVRVFLQPIADPTILGLYSFAGGATIVGAFLAGWYGTAQTPTQIAPFVALFGGIAQFVAGLWGYRARDGLATILFTLWGSLWASYGLLYLLVASGLLRVPIGPFPELGFWFLVVAWITAPGIVAAGATSWSLVATVAMGVAATAVVGAGEFAGSGRVLVAGGWLLVFAGVLAWYTASSVLLRFTFRRTVLPGFETRYFREAPPLSSGVGEPGVRRG